MKKLIITIACIALLLCACSCGDTFHPEEICLSAVLKEFSEDDDVWAVKVVKLDDIPHNHDFEETYEITVYTDEAIFVYVGGIEYRGKTISVDMDYAYSIAYETHVEANGNDE